MLVILGLLTGGILAGQSLIRAAELRSVSTEYQRWVAASNSFRDKYFALAGDFPQATSFWGAAGGTSADNYLSTCYSTSGTGTQTCNGNGDGLVGLGAGGSQYAECFMFWQHLANAGLIEGKYTGISGPSRGYEGTAANEPHAKLSGGFWFAVTWNATISGNSSLFDGSYRENYLEVGSLVTGAASEGGMLKPEEIWNIDTKIDDGKPASGKVRVRYPTTCTTASSSADLTASYLLTSSNLCVPLFTM